MQVVVLGTGRVGSAMVRDLANDKDLQITAVDITAKPLYQLAKLSSVTTLTADLLDTQTVAEVVAGHDLVVGAVPGPMGFATVDAVIDAGINMVDISFFAEDPFRLDEKARERGVTVITDCGIAPGWSNLAAGHLNVEFDELHSLTCYVGGLPVVRHWPYEYKAVFSPIDVIAEYTRPARFRRAGRECVAEALSDVELLDFPGVGTLEAFNSDGLRTLLETLDVPDMIEKTMRYPGHAEKMRMLRETGFFSEEPIEVGDTTVSPIDLTAKLLFPAWELAEGEQDITVLRMVAEGTRQGTRYRRTYDLLDRYDRAGGITSMARTTGYTCTAGVRLLIEGLYAQPGIIPPEYLGKTPGCFERVNRHLEERGIVFAVEEGRLT